MLALLGGLLTVAGAAGTGYCLCLEQKQRAKQLEQLARVFFLVAGEMAYCRSSLPQVFSQAAARAPDGLGKALERVAWRMEDGLGLSMEEIWREEMGCYLKATGLDAQERSMVLSFPEEIWFLDTARQQAAVDAFAQRLGERAQQVETEGRKREKATMALSLSAGILAAILLL